MRTSTPRLTIAVAAWLLLPGISFHRFAVPVQSVRSMGNKFLAVPVIYLAVIFAGGYLIRFAVAASPP